MQYFYFYVLRKSNEFLLFKEKHFVLVEHLVLNYRKQENEFESILTDLINGKYSFINQLFSSSILTSIIEDFILPSSLANEYLSSQPIVINQVEYSLPFVRNVEYENDLLSNNDIALAANSFSDVNDLEGYLNCCERKFHVNEKSILISTLQISHQAFHIILLNNQLIHPCIIHLPVNIIILR